MALGPLPTVADTRISRRSSDHLVRAIAAALIAQVEHDQPDVVLKRLWPADDAAPWVVRAATTPAATGAIGWAAELVASTVVDFIRSLAPQSAAAAVLARGLQVSFNRSGVCFIPAIVPSANDVGWVAEAAPIRVHGVVLDHITLTPRKLAAIAAFTAETFSYSTPTVESIVRTVLAEAVTQRLDASLFDDSAGDDTHPPGLRNGIAALPASAATPATEGMLADVASLLTAVGAVAGTIAPVIVASPAQAARLRVYGRDIGVEVLASGGLAAGVVLALAPNALVSATDTTPRFFTSKNTTLHMEDTTPLAINAGTPASPVRGLWQTDAQAVKLIVGASWGLRHASGVSWMSGVLW